ncbi:Metal cation efflux system protein CzcD [bacterium HR12]|nr:Metal cation efflux system protein CzcD [bacterium HR12]GIU98405.1 MAG: cation transporter [Actinomycetota bacterium]
MEQFRSAAALHSRRLVAVFALTLSFLLVEIVGGIITNSLALLADAGHMFTDVAGIGLALLAIRLAARPASTERTFGWYRMEILAAVTNAVILFGVAIYVLYEAWRRLMDPPEVAGELMLAVAVAGMAANGISLWLLRHAQAESLNMRGAYLEVLGDLLGSVAVVVAAAVIALTGFREADAIASAAIGLMIVPRTWKLLRDAVDVLLEATPKGVDLQEVRRHILEVEGVLDVHDLHAWTITSGMHVVSAHVVVRKGVDPAAVLDSLSTCLSDDFDIEHSTFQLETHDRRPLEEASHP